MNEREIFINALKLRDAADRQAYLAEACGDNVDLRRQVEALLAEHDQLGNFLGSPAAVVTETVSYAVVAEQPGTAIGPYKLLQQIGEGGFGIVYMADQQAPVRRRVALKIIKPGMDTREVLARFKAELQALSLMDHPNIARALDAGATDSGRPYFVMELVRGVPITEYCDRNNLPVHERLDLFIQVCHAVQHAHQKGIIHRDIKPSNVLVTLNDGRAVPKVIDFGVAKAIDRQLTPETLFTRFAEMIGTPLYMSPEQAEMTSLDIDTRADIYSLGVLLYELLTGSTPFDRARLQRAAFDEIRRIIREEEPPKPSLRISTLGDTRTAVAAHRQADPHRLSQLLRGDLDWIVMKALEKDRTRRYETANNFATDVLRYLSDRPVEACPPSGMYRFRKFARRNRVAITTGAVVLTALLLGTVVSVTQAIRATRAEQLAEHRLREETEARNEAEVARLTSEHALQAEAAQRQIAEGQRSEAERMRNQAQANFRQARRAVDEMYTQVAEKWLADQPQMQPIQRQFLQKALHFYAEFAQQVSTDPAVRLETARAYGRVAEIQYKLGDAAQAEDAGRKALDQLESLVHEFPQVPEYRHNLADFVQRFGELFGELGRYPESLKFHRRALALQKQLVADFPNVPEYRSDLVHGLLNEGTVLDTFRRLPEAEKVYRSALAIQTSLVAQFPAVPEYRLKLAIAYAKLARALRSNQQRLQALHDSEAILEKLVAELPSVPQYRNELAAVYSALAENLPRQRAEQTLRKALALQETLAADFPAVVVYRYDLVRSLQGLGVIMSRTGRPQEAEKAFQQASSIGTKLVAECPAVVYYRNRLAEVYSALGELLRTTGRLPEAVDAYRLSIDLHEKLVAEFPNGPDDPPLLIFEYCRLNALLVTMGRVQQADEMARKLIAMKPVSPAALNNVAWFLATCPDLKFRDPKRAVDLAQKAVELDPKERGNRNTLGVACYRAGKWKAAIEALEKSVELRSGGDAFDWLFLAMAHWQLGAKAESRKQYDRAVAWMNKKHLDDDELRRFHAEAQDLLGLKDAPAPKTPQKAAPAK